MSTHEGLTRIRFRFRNEPKIWKIPNYFSKIDRLKILNISPKTYVSLTLPGDGVEEEETQPWDNSSILA